MKLVAIDMDGTLLNSQNEIPEKNIQAIKQMQSEEIQVVIATGRSYMDAAQLLKKAGVSAWIIGANGATMHNPEGECTQSVSISKQAAESILTYLTEREFYYEVFSDRTIYAPENGQNLLRVEMDRIASSNPGADLYEMKEAAERQFSQQPFTLVSSYKEILKDTSHFYNLLAFSYDEAKLQKAWEQWASHKELTLTASASHVFDIMHRSVSKGNALKKLAEHFHVQKKDVLAIGDNFNDLSMFKEAGTSVAMKNAPEPVKSQADIVALENNAPGVAHILHELILRKKGFSFH